MKTDRIRELTWVVLLVVLSFLILWPVLKPGFIVTDDGDWMIIRLSAFYQSLREGQFPVRFLGRLNFNYGYPVANFLYPGFLYLGSLFHLVGLSFVDSVKMIIIGSIIGSVVFLYFWLRIFFKSVPSFLGALSFAFAPYVLFDIYKRGSVGEILALFFACLLLYAVDAGKKWIVPLAFGMLLISHNTLGLLFTGLLGVYIIYSKRNFLFLPFGIGLGMATFFWAPALYEKKFVIFDTTAVSNPFAYFASGETTYLLGYTMIATCILVFFLKYHKYNEQRKFLLTVFCIGMFLATPISAPIWNWELLGRIIQFPFRFLALNVLSGTWLLAYVVSRISVSKYIVIPLVIVLFISQTIPIMQLIRFQEKEEGFYFTNEATTTVADEYMPKWVTELPKNRAFSEIEVYDGIAKILSQSSTTQTIQAIVESQGESTIQINSLYYPGWGVLVNNQRVPIEYESPKNTSGVIRFRIPSGISTIYSQFRETVPRFIANVISFLFIVLYLVYVSQQYTLEKLKDENS